jgi:hypothetical protein
MAINNRPILTVVQNPSIEDNALFTSSTVDTREVPATSSFSFGGKTFRKPQFSSGFTFFSSDSIKKNTLSEIRTAQSSSGDSEWKTGISTRVNESTNTQAMFEKPLYTLTPFDKHSFSHQYFLFLRNNKNIDDLAKTLEREPWFVETFMKHLLKEPQETAAPLLSELAKKLDLKQILGEGKTFQAIQQMIPESFAHNMSAKMKK